ncbi:MAG: RNA 3'-phosphate cyclase, partial [Chloroflexi bacterium]|nr:RNA 3'-phosphate cyclase [Chloroflexota bacterium]
QLHHIRANRSRSGLRPQHLTAVRAVAAVCQAKLTGAELNSTTLEFIPQCMPQGGSYLFDVADASQGGSAGSVTLVLQAILWPLLFAPDPSTVTLRGGTHVPFSPSYHYLAHVALPLFAQLGVDCSLYLNAWGWYPVGGGEITAVINPSSPLQTADLTSVKTDRVSGVAAVTNLPAHIPQRMARRAHNLLTEAGFEPDIEPLRRRGQGTGAGLMLWLPNGGFSALGRKGLPADKVAETAVSDLLAFTHTDGMVDEHLADQLLIPLALANGETTFTTQRLTQHTITNARLIQRWLGSNIEIDGKEGSPTTIRVFSSEAWKKNRDR